jgi:hypothetical protein
MGRACSIMGLRRGAYRVLVGKPEGKRSLGRPRLRWEDMRRVGKYELLFVNRTKTLIYSLKLKMLLYNIISLVCDALAPAVRKLADAARN